MSELSRLAAQNFENILQCCIPCFDSLFPSPHNKTILDLLYILGYWHSLAKLWMHTDTSLKVFCHATSLLGDALRYFALETCCHFNTVETDSEYQARNRALAKRLAKAALTTAAVPVPTHSSNPTPVTGPVESNSSLMPSASLSTTTPPTTNTIQNAQNDVPLPTAPATSGKRKKTFNVYTPKHHVLPDYADQIEQFGTTDCFSTVVVCSI